MTEVELRSERCPFCNVEIDWDKLPAPNTFRGWCPNCGKGINSIKIRFL
ncbi:MAG: hypothetical protein KGD73_09250 [Candidatus Lokiarchaeota archaeon]|nr:hypothetical protein [Candidatus Lokiarchaeota archaeon]